MAKNFALGDYSTRRRFIALGVAIGIPYFIWIYGELTNSWKEPYLQSNEYPLKIECEKYLKVGNYIPKYCAQSKYMVNSLYYVLKYHLPQYGRSREGWLRVGTSAALIRLCTTSCEVVEIIPNVFGAGANKAR